VTSASEACIQLGSMTLFGAYRFYFLLPHSYIHHYQLIITLPREYPLLRQSPPPIVPAPGPLACKRQVPHKRHVWRAE
jgi:hypothetical protein